MYARAVWVEKGKEMEGTVPFNWIYIKLNGSPEDARVLVVRKSEELDKFIFPPIIFQFLLPLQQGWVSRTILPTESEVAFTEVPVTSIPPTEREVPFPSIPPTEREVPVPSIPPTEREVPFPSIPPTEREVPFPSIPPTER
uniref:Uncharacterized protein n=1 Tax=Knipowitschia caucasica TaxID=637954 RepID=A0AAV2JXT1_KNICA